MKSTVLRAIALVSLITLAAATLVGVAEAAATIVVDSTGDTNTRDSVLTLREAILLATGDLAYNDLNASEKDNVTGAPGPGSSDTITFQTGVFPSGSPATIALGSALPNLHTGNDTVDGSVGPAGVIVSGGSQSFWCFTVNSNGNAIRGLRVRDCQTGIGIDGGAQSNTIGGIAAANQRNVIVANWNGVGIYGSGTSGNQIVGNQIGFIDGTPPTSQPNGSGIDIGDGASGNTIGGTTTAHRNVIAGNWNAGVNISSASNTVIGNYIGTGPSGTAALANGNGVTLSDAASNVIGGGASNQMNVISGNNWAGVYIWGSAAWGNQVLGNYIGTNAAGTAGLGGQAGVQISSGPHDNVIGGATAGQMNLISGNGQQGVRIEGSGTSYNRVIGNRIGTNAAGTGFLGNANEGVTIQYGAWGNSVGGWATGEGNLISGNNWGVGIRNAGTFGNRVINNRIGTDASGASSLGNSGVGVGVQYGAENTLVSGNLISGNNGQGVQIQDPGSSGNTVSGNLIGTKLSGIEALPNQYSGVWIWDAENNSVIGGNVISGNGGGGVRLSGSGSYGNTVQGNRIGPKADGSGALGNNGPGVSIDQGAHDNTINGGNVISGNNTGVSIQNSGTRNNRVTGNNIGTNPNGDAAMPNNTGVDISDGAQSNTVAGTGMGDGNVISGNSSYGVAIHDEGTSGNTVVWNRIGTNSGASAPLPNGEGVVFWSGARDNTIGPNNLISGNNYDGVAFYGGTSGNRVISNGIGTGWGGYGSIPNSTGVVAFYGEIGDTVGGAGGGNVISGNNNAGVSIMGASGLKVLGNFIGTDASGAAPLPNGGPGVQVTGGCGAWHNIIGWPGGGNVIAFNGGDGVRVDGGCTVFNSIRGNSIHSNDGMGIQNINGGNMEIAGPNILSQNPITGTTCPNCTVDIYTDYEDEGRYYEGSVVAGIGGNFTFSGSLFGPWLTATTTDTSGSTSEFTAPIGVIDTGDDDHDGVPNYLDACPTVPEDIDGYHDGDGCPDPDNDGDGFPDFTDQCPGTDTTVGDDGIPCTNDTNEINTCEDYDGVLDTDGCHDSPGEDFDGDTLLDDDEVGKYWTSPDNPDTDGDGLSDGQEVLTYHTCPANNANLVELPQCVGVVDARDTDGGGVWDGDEVARGTDPLNPADDTGDIDGDTVPDSSDNCPLVPNPGQENTDSGPPPSGTGAIGNGKGIAGDDATIPNGDSLGDACDDDRDNDGIPNASDPDPGGDITYDDNGNGVPCFQPTIDPADDGPSWESNCNGVRDGVEGSCPLAVNPNGDDDGDGLLNTWEVCKWGTNPSVIDTDADGKGDCVEALDTNGDGNFGFGDDVLNMARAALLPAGTGPGQFGRDGDFDLNGNGSIGFGDDVLTAARMAFKILTCK
jgi:parallel beta-helix repeat protein